mgnify:CR=1 FL=1
MKEIYQKFIAMVILVCVLSTTILPTFVVYATDADEEEPMTATDYITGSEDKANLFERAVSVCLAYVAAQLYGLIGLAVGSADGGQPLTIESLFFNHYTNTRLTLFSTMSGGNNEFLTADLKATINMFYKFFTSLAVIAYMMMLIYIGIRILLNAGTAQNAKYKEFILYWVIGVAILFLFPYVMKYTIVINNAFVTFIDTNKTAILNVGDSMQQAGFTGDGSSTLNDVTSIFNTTHSKLMNGTDYMSLMYQLAFEKGWLVYTLCFIIMTKQLLTLIILYFKRLLMTIFLMIVFPLVTISYAIDKLGDGKSQAFGNWCKEFVLNVFIQSFHAIVYVIGMAMIFKLGNFGDNWLILMMLITFISKGDELLRHIFNINGSGAKTVDDSKTRVKQTRGAVMLATKAGAVASKTFGAESHLGRATQWAGQLAGNARDYRISSIDAANARDDVNAFSEHVQHNMADLNAPQTITDAALIALDENSTELERNKALDSILAVMNMEDGEEKEKALNELAAHFKDNPEALKDLEDMLKVRAAQNAIMVGGLTPVELNEQIEIILKRMKGKGLAAKMAAGLVTAHDLEKIKTAGKINFRRPEEDSLAGIKGKGSSKSGGTRKKGDRYSGTFRSPAAYRMHQARLKNQRGKVYKQLKEDIADATSLNPIRAGKEIIKGQYVKKNGARYKKVRAGVASVGDLNRRIRAAKKELRELERSGNKGTPAYRKVQENLSRWTKTASKSAVKKSRKGSAKVEQPGAVYNDSTGKIHQNVERKKAAKKTKKTRDEVYEVAGVRDSFLKKQNLNKRNTLNTSMGRPGQSASKFKVHGVKYTGFKNARISGKNALSAGRTGVSLKRPSSVNQNQPDYAKSSTPTPKVSTQTKKAAKERRQNANARNNYESQGNPLTKHSAIRNSRKEAQKELRNAQAAMRNSQSGTDAYKQAKEREAEAFKRLAEIQSASDRLNAKRGKKASEIRSKGITLNNNGIKGGTQYSGQMTKAEDTSVHVIKPEKTMRERAEANALKRAVAKEPEPVSIFADKFTEAIRRSETSGSTGTGKVRILSSEVMELAAKPQKVEEPKTSIKGMHSSSTKDSTVSSQRETVIVVRDGSAGYDGATTGKNVIALSSKSDYEKAQKLVADVEKARAAKATTTDGNVAGMTKEKIHETAVRLAASVTAINQSEHGDYTASEIVAHIDNIKAIMSSHKKGSEEYDVCLELVKKLQYDLSDFESSVRIQVLNDPSLIADSDPHRDKIMDSSIRHVKSMGDEDILLTMLRYDQDDLQVGKPMRPPKQNGYHSVAGMASTGFAMGADAGALKTAIEESLREKELQRRLEIAESERDANKAAMKKSAKSLASETLQAGLDLAINVPVSVGSGLILGAMSSQTMQGAVSGALGGYTSIDKTVDSARGLVGKGINAAGSVAGKVAGKLSNQDSSDTAATEKTPRSVPRPVDLKKAELRGKTTLGNGESLSERAKKMQNND